MLFFNIKSNKENIKQYRIIIFGIDLIFYIKST